MFTLDGQPLSGWGKGALQGLEGPKSGTAGTSMGQPPAESFAPETMTGSERFRSVVITPEEVTPISSMAESKEVVRQLQMRLGSKGFDPGKLDGLWGPKTAGALDKARQNVGLPEGTARVTILQRGLALPFNDAARIRDAINYQLQAKAAAKAAAAAAPSVAPMMPVPDRAMLPAAAGVSILKKWWFWGLLAVLVAGGGTAAYFLHKKYKEEEEYEDAEMAGYEPADDDDEF